MPTMTVRVTLKVEHDAKTTMTVETTFPSLEVMDQMVSMGMQEGMTAAIDQMDDLLGSHSTPA